MLLLLKLDDFFLYLGEQRNSLAASVLLKIREGCALQPLPADTVKNVSDVEPKQRKVCSSLSSSWVALQLILSGSLSWHGLLSFLQLEGGGSGLLYRKSVFLRLLFHHLQGNCYLHRWIHGWRQHEINHSLFFSYGNLVWIFLFCISDVRGKGVEYGFSLSLLIGFFSQTPSPDRLLVAMMYLIAKIWCVTKH